jgi:hypothetical protein
VRAERVPATPLRHGGKVASESNALKAKRCRGLPSCHLIQSARDRRVKSNGDTLASPHMTRFNAFMLTVTLGLYIALAYFMVVS